MKHAEYSLPQLQSLPLETKVAMSKRRIKDWYDYYDGQVYVSFSGGKDSTVLKHLVETTIGVYDVPSVFINTGLEYPEIQRFAMAQKNVTTLYPKMNFKQVIEQYGYPIIGKEVAQNICSARNSIAKGVESVRLQKIQGRFKNPDGSKSKFNCGKYEFLLKAPFKISDACCSVMKKRPAKKYSKKTGRLPILGTLACESALRLNQWLQHGCNGFEMKSPVSTPMAFWTEQDVLKYIKINNLPYCSVYGDIEQELTLLGDGKYYTTGCQRTGCLFCMFGVHLEKYPNRFQRMKVTHPKHYQYCMEQLGLKEILKYIGVKYE